METGGQHLMLQYSEFCNELSTKVFVLRVLLSGVERREPSKTPKLQDQLKCEVKEFKYETSNLPIQIAELSDVLAARAVNRHTLSRGDENEQN